MAAAATGTVVFVAPAAKAFTGAHIQDLTAQPAGKPEPYDGRTRCGLAMLAADLWMPVDLRPDDSVCRACRGISNGEQGTLC